MTTHDAPPADAEVFGVQLAQIAMESIRGVALNQRKPASAKNLRVRRIGDRAHRAIGAAVRALGSAGMSADDVRKWEATARESFARTMNTAGRFHRGRERS